MIEFSTIIPVYNRADLVTIAIESVLAQEFKDHEIIVVDDGSTDDTPNVLARYGDAIRVLRQENRGPGPARNLGIEQARGQYVAFLDSDDLWFPWTLATYAGVIEHFNQPALLSGELLYFTDQAALPSKRPAELRCTEYVDYVEAGAAGVYVGAGQSVLRRDVLLASGGFSAERFYAEDHDLVMRLGTAGRFIRIQAPPLIAYRQHAQSASGNCVRTYDGVRHLINQEKNGKYPGGLKRRHQRRAIITQHVRPVSLNLLKHGEFSRAWDLYRTTFAWQLTQRRVRYLAGFPLQLIRRKCRRPQMAPTPTAS